MHSELNEVSIMLLTLKNHIIRVSNRVLKISKYYCTVCFIVSKRKRVVPLIAFVKINVWDVFSSCTDVYYGRTSKKINDSEQELNCV